jgi:hypothetical protein
VPALAILAADPNPGSGLSEQRNADVASEMELIVSFQLQVTCIGFAAGRVIDGAAGPDLSRGIRLFESLQDFQAEQRPISQGYITVAVIA